jgi:hypothetical protein
LEGGDFEISLFDEELKGLLAFLTLEYCLFVVEEGVVKPEGNRRLIRLLVPPLETLVGGVSILIICLV